MNNLRIRLNKLTKRCEELEETNQQLRNKCTRMTRLAETFISIASPYSNKEKNKISRSKGYYPFVQNHSINSVTTYLKDAKPIVIKAQDKSPAENLLFLDAGCGVGNIMYLAKDMDYIVHGIERCRKNVKVAKRVVSHNNSWAYDRSQVFGGDILKFKKYHEYDVIYYFCPIVDSKMETEFELLVENTMKVGAVVIAFSKADGRIYEDTRFTQVGTEGSAMFLKVSK